jgi:hypothetical protein
MQWTGNHTVQTDGDAKERAKRDCAPHMFCHCLLIGLPQLYTLAVILARLWPSGTCLFQCVSTHIRCLQVRYVLCTADSWQP